MHTSINNKEHLFSNKSKSVWNDFSSMYSTISKLRKIYSRKHLSIWRWIRWSKMFCSYVSFFQSIENSIDYFSWLESKGLCADNDLSNERIIFSMTFASGSSQYSNSTPSFIFDPTYRQRFQSSLEDQIFAFMNPINNPWSTWHDGTLDHTQNDTGGYMFVIINASWMSIIFSLNI